MTGPAAAPPATPTEANRGAWARQRTLRWFAASEGWSDAGEQRVTELVAAEMSGKRILDLGVGAGRTVPLLRAISENYVGIDFSAPMVDVCREKHPDARVEVGDARDLSRFDDGSFDLVVFSWNGIDAVDHDDRTLVFDEVWRVLAPDGVFLFSTHNEHGRGCGEKPWTLQRRDLRHPRHVAAVVLGFPLNLRNHRRFRSMGSVGDGWSMRNAAAHHFGLVIHYTTFEQQLAELADAGFDSIEAFGNEHAETVTSGDDTSGVWWFQIVARRAARPQAATG
jgi:SAM-dependent methyltransferase